MRARNRISRVTKPREYEVEWSGVGYSVCVCVWREMTKLTTVKWRINPPTAGAAVSVQRGERDRVHRGGAAVHRRAAHRHPRLGRGELLRRHRHRQGPGAVAKGQGGKSEGSCGEMIAL
jgi:hypothetical protein